MNLNTIKNFFKKDRFCDTLGITIESVEEGHATCQLLLNETHLNGGGVIHGGVIFTLADFAFAVASNCTGQLTVSLNNSISYLTPPKGKVLIAEAKKLSSSKKICVYEVKVKDELGTFVAEVTVNGYIKDTSIEDLI